MYPVEPYTNWLPAPEMTDYGWGIEEIHLLLIDGQGEMMHDFGRSMDVDILAEYIK